MFNDLMENIEWFFNLHDKNKDGFLTKDEVLTLSESFLVSCSSQRDAFPASESPWVGNSLASLLLPSLSSVSKSEMLTLVQSAAS